MTPRPFFSICIPVYKNVTHLQRLLHSIFSQTFDDYEVVITDDSPEDNVGDWIRKHYLDSRIIYVRNEKSLGTPENWNEGIRKARGEWIKLMHDDDWFATTDALQKFHEATLNTNARFLFCGYRNVYLDEDDRVQEMPFSNKRWLQIVKYPPNIYARNIIGAPSTVLVKNDIGELYDKRFKWLVDIDYYIRVMQKTAVLYIPQKLVHVGQSNSQVTAYTHNKPAVEIPEGLLLQSKLGPESFKHILYFDVWWRLIRNLEIRDIKTFESYSGSLPIPATVLSILRFQKMISASFLKVGPISKILMTICWIVSVRTK